MNRDDYRHLLLSGTVTFPATFPQIGRISLISEPIPCGVEGQKQRNQEMLIVQEFPSARVTITRKLFADNVRAVFIPQDPNRVNYACGTWLLANEIAEYLRCEKRVHGIAFVSETESTLLEVRAGMTAGESAQYYPPLPTDRSYNHYGGQPKQRHMMSCDTSDDSLAASSTNDAEPKYFRSMVIESPGAEFSFACDGHDEIAFELFSCDGSDSTSDS
jgi:hypothetical protein